MVAAPQPAAAEDAGGASATAAGPAIAGATVWDVESTMAPAEGKLSATGETAQPAEAVEPATAAEAVAATAGAVAAGDSGEQPYSPTDLIAQATPPPMAPPVAQPPIAPPAGPPTAEPHNRPGFQLAEVQLAQKYFNESQFTTRIRDVRKSLGKPNANLTKLIGAEPRALVTVAWDIIWYQYLVDLRRDIPTDERVALHREGMDLDELTADVQGEERRPSTTKADWTPPSWRSNCSATPPPSSPRCPDDEERLWKTPPRRSGTRGRHPSSSGTTKRRRACRGRRSTRSEVMAHV